MSTIVSKDSLKDMLINAPEDKRVRIIGRALVALFDRQTRDEQATNDTKEHNNIGFTGGDARGGSLTAKYFLKHGKLESWQVERWMKVGKSGYPRLCKYHKQLDAIAKAKAAKEVA